MSPDKLPPDHGIFAVVPAHNAEDTIDACLQALLDAGLASERVVVVDDGSSDRTGDIARGYNVRLLRNDTPQRPAEARNLGASDAKGDVLLFVDADVRVHPDAISRIQKRLDEGFDGVIGSYDDAPDSASIVGRYRNLLHSYTHQTSAGEVPTFWTGLGAIRRWHFDHAGGLKRAWENIEDVEFGLRVTQEGGKIFLDPAVQGTHMKDWSFVSMFQTDMNGRAVPWTRLLKSGRMPLGVLSTSRLKRLSAAFTAAAALFLLLGLMWSGFGVLTLIALAGFLAVNIGFFSYLARLNGLGFATAAYPLHLAHNLAALLGYAKETLIPPKHSEKFEELNWTKK